MSDLNKKTLKGLDLSSGPLVIAGPCSVESENQMMETALALSENPHIQAIRGGVWKPRTMPGNFEGLGEPALNWLKNAGKATKLKVMTEVANAEHVEQSLKAGIDMLWIGARTTVNPFYVQEIADALKGVDIPVFVKNPIHPEVKLWVGALERLNKTGITDLAAIHRGFFAYQSAPYRNEPKWEVSFELRRLMPEIPIICDPSHIAGKRDLIEDVCQSALDLGMDGFMIESHINPSQALSDADQQLRPEDLQRILGSIDKKQEFKEDEKFISQIETLRSNIDELDYKLLSLLKERIDIVAKLGKTKEEHQVTFFQMKRWFNILKNREEQGSKMGLNPEIIHELFQLIHKYSIDVQLKSRG